MAPACPHCGRPVAKVARPTAPPDATNGTLTLKVVAALLAALVGVAMVYGRMKPGGAVDHQASRDCPSSDHLSEVLCRYGLPDMDDSTENDRPRPPIVTRTLTYAGAGVRVVYVADAAPGAPSPYEKWRLLGFQDPVTDAKLSTDEARRRMEAHSGGGG